MIFAIAEDDLHTALREMCVFQASWLFMCEMLANFNMDRLTHRLPLTVLCVKIAFFVRHHVMKLGVWLP